MHRRRAFTLIDVLVTMAVVALLIGIMLPGLGRVTELSKQIVCRSNLRQVGFGLALYADANKDQLPASVFIDPQEQRENQVPFAPAEMMTLRLTERLETQTDRSWDGLGLLYEQDVLPSEEIFYCPSHHGDFKYTRVEPRWRRARGEIVGNYHFRGRGPNNGSTRLSFIEPSRSAIAADGMRTLADYNHRVGLNVLRADLSLFWLADDDGAIEDYIAEAGTTGKFAEGFDLLWDQLDSPSDPVLPDR